MFDHIAHEMTTQQDIYQMIGQECVQQTVEVGVSISRGSTAAYSPTGKPAPVRATLFWVTRGSCRQMPTVCPGASCLGSLRILAKSSATGRMARLLSLARIFRFIISRSLIWYFLCLFSSPPTRESTRFARMPRKESSSRDSLRRELAAIKMASGSS